MTKVILILASNKSTMHNTGNIFMQKGGMLPEVILIDENEPIQESDLQVDNILIDLTMDDSEDIEILEDEVKSQQEVLKEKEKQEVVKEKESESNILKKGSSVDCTESAEADSCGDNNLFEKAVCKTFGDCNSPKNFIETENPLEVEYHQESSSNKSESEILNKSLHESSVNMHDKNDNLMNIEINQAFDYEGFKIFLQKNSALVKKILNEMDEEQESKSDSGKDLSKSFNEISHEIGKEKINDQKSKSQNLENDFSRLSDKAENESEKTGYDVQNMISNVSDKPANESDKTECDVQNMIINQRPSDSSVKNEYEGKNKKETSNRHVLRKNRPCSVCKKTFSRLEHLNRHLKLHLGHYFYECAECNKTYTRKDQLSTHWHLKHSQENLDLIKKKSFSCNVCNKSFSSKWYLKRHWFALHSEVKLFKCDKCAEEFTSNYMLKKHFLIHSRNNCTDHDEGYKRNNYTLRNRSLIRPRKTACCGDCDGESSTSKGHSQKNLDQSFSCNECHERFSRKWSLKTHWFALHSEEQSKKKEFSCDKCGGSFAKKSKLKIHLSIHFGSMRK